MKAKHKKEEMELMEYVVKIYSSLTSCVYKKSHLLFNSVSKALQMIVLNGGLMMNNLMQEVTQNNNNNPVHKTSISI